MLVRILDIGAQDLYPVMTLITYYILVSLITYTTVYKLENYY